jgi:hypothetical protein
MGIPIMSGSEKEEGKGTVTSRPPERIGKTMGECDYCGREPLSFLLGWEEEEGLWLCRACHLELGSCGCSD